MKAKIKATGKIIDVSRAGDIITSNGVEKQYVDNNREWCTVSKELIYCLLKWKTKPRMAGVIL